MQCPNCGNVLLQGDLFCGQCGSKAGSTTALISQIQAQEFYTAPTVPNTIPSSYSEYIHKGVQLFDLQRYQEALVAFDEAIRLNPYHALAHYTRGYTLLELGRYEEAYFAFDEAIRFSINPAYSHYGKYETLKALKRYEEAEVSRSEAIRLGYPPPVDKTRGTGKRVKRWQKH